MDGDDFLYLGLSFTLVPILLSMNCKNFFPVFYRLRRRFRFRFSFLSVEDDFRYLFLSIFHAGSVSGLAFF